MGQVAQCPDDAATRVNGRDQRADTEPLSTQPMLDFTNGHQQATEGKSRASTDPGLPPKEQEGQTQLGRCVAFSAARVYRLEANGLPEHRVEHDVENGLPSWDGDPLWRGETPASFESDKGFEAAVRQRECPGTAESGYTVSTTAKSEDNNSSSICKLGRQEADMRRRSSYGRDPRKMSVRNVDTGLVVGADATCRMSVTANKSSRPSHAQGKPFPKRPMMSRLSRSTWTRLEELFRKMDMDGSNAITRGKANSFFEGAAFGKISCDAMFNEVDVDGSGVVTTEEFLRFWMQVRSSGYSDRQILEEVEELLEGGAWVDWKDNRDTTSAEVKFPKRPLFCRLSQKAWRKCEELFRLMDQEGTMVITQNNALSFFKGSFAKVSCDAMFNEIDECQHGVITAAEWMKFWTQVKAAGYKEATIIEEIDLIMDGGSWVDWKDNRSPC